MASRMGDRNCYEVRASKAANKPVPKKRLQRGKFHRRTEWNFSEAVVCFFDENGLSKTRLAKKEAPKDESLKEVLSEGTGKWG